MKVSKKKKSYRERQNQEIFSEHQRKYIGGDRSEFGQFPEKIILSNLSFFIFFFQKEFGAWNFGNKGDVGDKSGQSVNKSQKLSTVWTSIKMSKYSSKSFLYFYWKNI